MPLAVGSKLGPYEIVAPLGGGGMGEVYRARDSRLDRPVAIKILTSEHQAGAEMRERFELEARTISNLSHPHICTLYDVGRYEDTDFLVMEYLEGETVEKRLERGPLPLDQALKIAIEVSDALDKAHRQGVIHRDLKPANIMLTKAGAKLMDFGLAKLRNDPVPAVSALTEMATAATKKLTAEGMIVGTFQYMAPEQLEGAEADVRSDIFALGEVIYEMAAGGPAFSGRTKASLIASILSSDPKPISEVAPMTPPALDRLVRTCLAKDPDERWQTAHDVRLQLQWIAEAGSKAGVPAPLVAQRKQRERVVWAAAAVLLLVAPGGYWLAYQQSIRSYGKAIRSSIEAPSEKVRFALTADTGGPPAISPEGTRIAFAAIDADGRQSLWIRSLDSLIALSLPGTDNATFPFWSPDGRWLAFFANGKLSKISAEGGPTVTLCDAPVGRGGDWSRDNVILFSPNFRAGLMRVSAAGGATSPVTKIEGTTFTSNRWPQFLPDGKHFLYLAVHHENASKSVIFLGSLEGGEPVQVMESPSSFRYVNGYLLFLRQGALLAQRYDVSKGLQGDPTPVAENVLSDDSIWRGVFDASQNGLLVYQRGTGAVAQRLAWFDRTGKKLSEIEMPTGFQNLSLSPDGKHLAVQGNPSTDIWSYDLTRGVHIRLTFDSAVHQTPIWSPDGKWVAYVSSRNGPNDIYRKPADGTGSEEPLVVSPINKQLGDWSRDGKYILYVQTGEKAGADFWVMPLSGDRKPFPVLQTPFNNSTPLFSPDGRWILYVSDESGQNEAYVMPFQGAVGKWQISNKGASIAAWRRDGKEILYVANDSRIMAAAVSSQGSQFQVGEPRPLTRPVASSQSGFFQISADGQRVLAAAPSDEKPVPLTLVFNWTASLKK